MKSDVITAGLTLLITAAIVALVVSRKSQTATVISAFGNAVSSMLSTALSPVTQS